MQEKDFKFIDCSFNEEVGVYTINLFEGINEHSAANFVSEFKWLTQYEDAKRIDIRINSQGGSVLHGWSIVDAILTSKVPTRAICVGVAASMASVIMCVANEALMMAYASLMVHNPFYPGGKKPENGEALSPQIETFRAQLIEIYMARWGKSESEVTALMDGEEGQDGTWFKADEAINMGLVSKVIPTPTQYSNKFLKVSNDIQNCSAEAELLQSKFQEIINNQKNEEHMIKDVVAKLGLPAESGEQEVISKISAVIADNAALLAEKLGAETTIKNANASIADLQATVTTKESEIAELTAKVAEFEKAEKDAETARQLAVVEAAVSEGKINEEDKEAWVTLFATSPENAEKVLAQLQSVGTKKKLSTQVKPEEVKATGEEAEYKLPTINGIMDEIEAKRKK
jgi:ATP-dependent Clp protease protease subunit